MREHSSATHRRAIAASRTRSRAIASRLLTAVRRFWREGVYIQELMLSGPWEREGQLRWRRLPSGDWELVGATAPPRPAELPAPSRAGVSPRRAPSSC